MSKFDVMVIGGGPAGYLAASLAGGAGFSTAVAENRSYGGVCLNEGCIPSKTFLNSAKVFEYAKHSEDYGVKTADPSVDQSFVVDRKNKVVKTLVAGVKAKLKGAGAIMFTEKAVIAGKEEGSFVVMVGNEKHLADKLIIATGSEALVPNITGVKEGLESGLVVTNREILDAREIPKKLVVVGGGVIGIEMASYFNSVGSQVTVIEMLSKIGGQIDGECADIIQKEYERKGIKFILNGKVASIGSSHVEYELDGASHKVDADMVLLSVGRKGNTQGIGLETLGVHTERGYIVTDHHMRTNISGVYATGDINGKSMLAHTAYREAEVAVNHLRGEKDYMRYGAIAGVIYTTPEYGGVGETTESAKEKGLDVEIVTLPMSYSGRYLAESGTRPVGICKLIMDKRHRNLVGVHLVGTYASEIIYGAALMVENETTVDDLKELVIPHPTVGEIIHNALVLL